MDTCYATIAYWPTSTTPKSRKDISTIKPVSAPTDLNQNCVVGKLIHSTRNLDGLTDMIRACIKGHIPNSHTEYRIRQRCTDSPRLQHRSATKFCELLQLCRLLFHRRKERLTESETGTPNQQQFHLTNDWCATHREHPSRTITQQPGTKHTMPLITFAAPQDTIACTAYITGK